MSIKRNNITIRRLMPNNRSAEDIKVLRSMRFVISPVGDRTTGNDLTGLTQEELNKYMPILTNTIPAHPDYNQRKSHFWANLVLVVPDEGVTLNIKTDAEGNPENLLDYVNWKRALKHPRVAASKAEAEGDKNISFYIYDPEAETRTKQLAIQTKMDADRLYMEIQPTDEKVSYILLGMGKSNIHRLSKDQRQVELYDLKEKQPALFTALAKDKNLQYKAEVQLVLDEGSLKRTNTGYYFGSGSDERHIGDTIEDIIRFITKPENSGTYLRMKGIIKGMNIAFEIDPKKSEDQKAGVQLTREESTTEVLAEVGESKEVTEPAKRGPKPKE